MSDYDRQREIANQNQIELAQLLRGNGPRSSLPRAKLREAQSYAASVRARRPEMQVKRLTERETAGEGVKA